MSEGRIFVECYFEGNNETVCCDEICYHEAEGLLGAEDGKFWMYLILYGVLVCFAGESILHIKVYRDI